MRVVVGESNCFKIVKMIMERNFAPAIVFSFSKKDCEAYAMQMSRLDFNTGRSHTMSALSWHQPLVPCTVLGCNYVLFWTLVYFYLVRPIFDTVHYIWQWLKGFRETTNLSIKATFTFKTTFSVKIFFTVKAMFTIKATFAVERKRREWRGKCVNETNWYRNNSRIFYDD